MATIGEVDQKVNERIDLLKDWLANYCLPTDEVASQTAQDKLEAI